MRSDYLFTSESVSEGHPDKVSDQISDSIVDLFLSKDPEARIACDDDAVVVHPPPNGAVLDGYPLYRTMSLQRDGLLAVGRARFRLTVLRPS